MWRRRLSLAPGLAGPLAAMAACTLASAQSPAQRTIEPIAGDGTLGFRCDGGLACGPGGRLYFARRNNHRIRALTPAPPPDR